MGNSIFQNKIAEIRKALELELYNCALIVALTLPDICGKVEYPFENKANCRYKCWFDKYAMPLFTVTATTLPRNEMVGYTFFTSEECWALRCSVLHAGNYNIEKVDLANVSFHAHKRNGENYSHYVRDSYSADFDVIQICETLCSAAEQFYLKIRDKSQLDVDEIRIVTW